MDLVPGAEAGTVARLAEARIVGAGVVIEAGPSAIPLAIRPRPWVVCDHCENICTLQAQME